MYPLPNISRAPAQSFNYRDHPADGERAEHPAGVPLRLSADDRSCARPAKYSGLAAAPRRDPGPAARASTTRRCSGRSISNLAVSANYNLSQHDVPRGHLRPQPQRAGGLRAGADRHRADLLPRRGPDERRTRTGSTPGSAALPLLFPNANKLNPEYYATAALNGMNPAPPAWVNGDFVKPPAFALTATVSRQRAAEHPVPDLLQRQRDAGLSHQPDQGHWAGTR